MPRQTQITKERILNAAMDVLIREGFSAVNIKSIAKELGCSTQPIAWQFGNMDSMRKALAKEAIAYANQKMSPTTENCIEAFWHVGHAYIDLAFDAPSLFRFVYMGESHEYSRGDFGSILTDKGNVALIDGLCRQLGISKEQSEELFQRAVVYTHGIASLVVTGILDCTKEQVYGLVLRFAADQLALTDAVVDIEAIMAGVSERIGADGKGRS